jgi:Amt family ammonium transporter
MDWEGIGRVAGNTTLAACAGGLVAVFFVYPRAKKWDVGMSMNGFLGGLVAITAPCYWVTPSGAIAIGAIAGIIVPLGIDLLEYIKVDDPIGAVPVHAICGIWGTLSIGLFASGFGIPGPDGPIADPAIKGLFYGGGMSQLWVQCIGSAACVVVVSLASILIFGIIRQLPGSWNLRLERELELEGIDIAEHGLTAYHMEFGQGMTYVTASGLGGASGSVPKEPIGSPTGSSSQ